MKNKNQRRKKQHYVPQFYLRNFANPKKGQYYFFVFDIISKKKYSTNIKNAACEHYFYDKHKGVDQFLEKKLSRLENKFRNVNQLILSKKDLNKLNKKEMDTLTCFITMQYLRTKKNRQILERFPVFIEEYAKSVYGNNVPQYVYEKIDFYKTKDSIRNVHIDVMNKDYQIIFDILSNMKWSLGLNKTEEKFWTSDNPIVVDIPSFSFFEELIKYSSSNKPGILTPGALLTLPLSPEVILQLYKEDDYNLPNIVEFDKKAVKYQNRMMYHNVDRQIYSMYNDFTFAELLNKN